ncbi:hypothetical protein MNBD_GAMMA03-1114 [hydrothermal vent metagenome]|uniref:Nuclear transport factor 2 family protein n=1 Tax=hydrothermal vent metagenome TaxID=652676 RepID=A0A3B0W1C7_9ZZZZ
MSKKQILFFIIILSCMLNLSSCSRNETISKQQLLLQSIEQLEHRFEERKLGSIIEYISANYQDTQGRNLLDIKRAIQMQLMRHKTLYVFSTIKDISWSDAENATVQITVAMAGKPIKSASILPSIRADMIKFSVDFILEDGIYKVKSAVWEWAKPTDFL